LNGWEVKTACVCWWNRFYDLMDLEPGYAELRASHGSTLDDARQKLFWFLCGWLGGPDHYVQRFGHPRSAHAPHAVFHRHSPSATSGWRV
jgi:truncated hemoglobin YjbI